MQRGERLLSRALGSSPTTMPGTDKQASEAWRTRTNRDHLELWGRPQLTVMPLSNSLATLNADQARAAHYGAGGGPLLIIAGAGSGKTQTLAHRVAHLIEHSANPGRILLLTFSRRAAQEM